MNRRRFHDPSAVQCIGANFATDMCPVPAFVHSRAMPAGRCCPVITDQPAGVQIYMRILCNLAQRPINPARWCKSFASSPTTSDMT